MRQFQTVNRQQIDLIDYSKTYIRNHPGVEVMVGCDSQNKNINTTYAVVVAFYNPGHGAHVVFNKWKTPKERVRSVRLLNEVWSAIEVAEEMCKNGLPKPKYIDIDVNPNPKYKSNEVFTQAVGMCTGMGYNVRYKSLAPLVTSMADNFARH